MASYEEVKKLIEVDLAEKRKNIAKLERELQAAIAECENKTTLLRQAQERVEKTKQLVCFFQEREEKALQQSDQVRERVSERVRKLQTELMRERKHTELLRSEVKKLEQERFRTYTVRELGGNPWIGQMIQVTPQHPRE